MTKIIIILLFLNTILISCSSMQMKIESEPSEATVYLKDGQKVKKLGVTPLNISSDQYSDVENFHLRIEKEGYRSHEIIVDKRSVSSRAKIFASMNKEELENNSSNGINSNTSSPISLSQAQQHRGLASIQSLLLQSQYAQAEVIARQFVVDNPFSSVGWSLLGNAYLLQNKNSLALESYQKSLEYEPENEDTRRIVERLKNNTPQRSR